ncbi:retrovirus-related pol polyprotein from transposon TNT 1-94 [Tanacetum coccineum]
MKSKGSTLLQRYQEHVAKYQQILDANHGKAEERTSNRLVKETLDDPLPAKILKAGLVGKRCKAKSPLRSIDEPSDKGVPVEEPAHDDKEADLQRALELSLKEQGEQTQGPDSKEEDSYITIHLSEAPYAHYEARLDQNPGVQDEGQARPNPGTSDASTQQKPEQMDEEFTTTAYPNVQENLKLPTEDQFFVEKPQEEEPGKTNVEAKGVLRITYGGPESKTNLAWEERLDNQGTTPLRVRFRDLPTVDMKEILQQRMFEADLFQAHTVTRGLYVSSFAEVIGVDYSNQRLVSGSTSRASGSSQLQPPLLLSTGTSSYAQQNKAIKLQVRLRWMIPFLKSRYIYLMMKTPKGLSPSKADSRNDWWKPLLKRITTSDAYFLPGPFLFNKSDVRHTAPQHCTTFEHLLRIHYLQGRGHAYEVVKAFYPDVVPLQLQMEEGSQDAH